MSRSWTKGSTRWWREHARPYVLARDGYRCQIRYPGTWTTRAGKQRKCMVVADCVDHIDGKKYGDDLARCQAACTPCNLRKGEPGRAKTRASDPRPQPVNWW